MTTTTTLVHRASPGPAPWWRQALVYEVPSPQLGAVEVPGLFGLLDHVVSLGMDTVLLRPSLMDAVHDLDVLARLTDLAHERGLRVLTRVSGGVGPVTGPHAGEDARVFVGAEAGGEELVRRSGAFLSAGADGVDVGTIVPPQVTSQTDLDVLSSYIADLHGMLALHSEDGILGADVSADYPDAMRHHLQEDWLHHLRDDSLVLARWDADSLTRHVTASLAEHDRFGAPPVWRVLPSFHLLPETDPGDGRRWFVTDAAERRRRAIALQTLALALPGAVYVRQGDEIAMLDADKPTSPLELSALVNRHAATQASEFGSPLATVRHATRLRRERRLASAPTAFVTGLRWCPPDALTVLVRDLLVLVNTSDAPVALPEHAEVLLSSQHLSQAEGRLLVPPSATAWLDAATVH